MKRFQNHSDWFERKEEKNSPVASLVSNELVACRRSVAKALRRIARLRWRDWSCIVRRNRAPRVRRISRIEISNACGRTAGYPDQVG